MSIVSCLVGPIRRTLRRLGYEIVASQPPGSLREHLTALFARLDINCVLDVGAHVGEYGLFLREMGYAGHIVSFEPVRASFAALQGRCAGDPRWTAWDLALGDREQVREMNVLRASQFSSCRSPNTLTRDQFGFMADTVGREAVPVTRLDRILSQRTEMLQAPRIYLKLDTQGSDLEVLEGAGEHAHAILALQIEVGIIPLYHGMQDYLTALARLRNAGFGLTGVFAVSRGRDLQLLECDCIFRRSKP